MLTRLPSKEGGKGQNKLAAITWITTKRVERRDSRHDGCPPQFSATSLPFVAGHQPLDPRGLFLPLPPPFAGLPRSTDYAASISCLGGERWRGRGHVTTRYVFETLRKRGGKKSLKREIFVVHLVFFVEIFYFEEEE